MSMSAEAVVNASRAIEGATADQQKDLMLLRKTLETRADTIVTLVEAAVPKLAVNGSIGTNVHTTA